MNMPAAIGNLAWLASNAPAHLRFCAALGNPLRTQLRLLRDYVEENGATTYGKAFNIAGIRSYEEFRRRVPLVTHDELSLWIGRIRSGEPNVLTRGRVTHLIPTSGSMAARKLIPFTAGLQREFNRAISPWICDLYAQVPSLALGSAYWSITPLSSPLHIEDSAVPIGFDDDMSYLGGVRKRILTAVTAVPSAVRFIDDTEAFRYITLLCLLRRRDLRLISVWHPSFLTLLMEALPRRWDTLLADVDSGRCTTPSDPTIVRQFCARPMPKRADELRSCDPNDPQTVWPSLRVISCWGDAHAEIACNESRRRFPQVWIQPKGLLATEAFVTIPFAGHSPMAVRSHFFEFIDDRGCVRLVDQLQENGEYEVVVTTAGGLWRYRLGDRVRVTGFVGQTPSLKFIGRNGRVSDRFGEKLSEAFVADVIQQLMVKHDWRASFAMLAPDHDSQSGLRYTLYVQAETAIDCAERLDSLLRSNPHYDYCRRLGQLQPARVFHVSKRGYETYVAHEMKAGKRLGEIKPCALSGSTGWSERFEGRYIGEHPLHTQLDGGVFHRDAR